MEIRTGAHFRVPDLKDLAAHVSYLKTCCLHEDMAKLADNASSVILAGGWCENVKCGGPPCGGSDNYEVWLFNTADKQVGVLEESEDYTGHG